MKMFLIPGDYLKLVLQGSYMSNADKIKLSGPNKEKFLQDIKVRNWMIKRYLLSTVTCTCICKFCQIWHTDCFDHIWACERSPRVC